MERHADLSTACPGIAFIRYDAPVGAGWSRKAGKCSRLDGVNDIRPELDARTHAFDPQGRLAEVALQGQLPGDGWRYVAPQAMQAGSARVSLRAEPAALAAQVTEALPGEALELLWENADGWARVRTVHDRYLGWTRTAVLRGLAALPDPLTVTALRAHAYAGPKVSQALSAELCLGSRLHRAPGDVVEEGQRRWVPVHLPGGEDAWVQEAVLSPLPDVTVSDLARRFLDTPYVWGGRSAWGLDCSGLTQVVFQAFGRALPRDADQQQAAVTPVERPGAGDLAFFPGHVGLMLDERHLLHANATHMRVTIDVLGDGDYGTCLQDTCTGFGRWPA